MALQNDIQEDPEHERDLQPPRSAKNDEILNFLSRVFRNFRSNGPLPVKTVYIFEEPRLWAQNHAC